ncbi:TPA: hypothetical protein I8669_002701 [Legionella pneumophila]|nr:hypothetical protein [Legionella pneumophila]
MKKSSKASSKKQTKEKVKKDNLKNISGGRRDIPDHQPDPGPIRRIVDEHF